MPFRRLNSAGVMGLANGQPIMSIAWGPWSILGSVRRLEFNSARGRNSPAKYQLALFINDWTYGKIYAVHMTPKGASYVGDFETFISGRPLPVTDITVNPVDGALYFCIGGRRTQSGLYRVTYVGKESTEPVGPLEDAKATAARADRKKLEAFHGRVDAAAVKTAWPFLSSSDRNLRYAARVAIENQPVDSWQSEALAETRPTAVIQLMVALARTGKPEVQAQVLAALNKLPLENPRASISTLPESSRLVSRSCALAVPRS